MNVSFFSLPALVCTSFLDIIIAYYVFHCIIVITLLWAWEYYIEYIAMYREYVLQAETFFDIILHLFVENDKWLISITSIPNNNH